MLSIKLINGLDFSGKTSVAHKIQEKNKNKYCVHHKFLTNLNTLDDMKEKGIFLYETKQFVPFLVGLIRQDIAYYDKCNQLDVVILDSLWPIKYVAKLLMDNKDDSKSMANSIIEAMRKYPKMDSYYLKVNYEERKRRYIANRKKEDTLFDKLIMNEEIYSKLEKTYISVLMELFSDTMILDTTGLSISDISDILENFF